MHASRPGRSTRLRPLVATTVAAALLAGCATTPDGGDPAPDSADGYPVTVDNCGEDVSFDAPPTSVMTIGTSAVWNIAAAGAGDRIVARSGEFGAPLGTDELTEQFAHVPIIDPSDPTTEAITGTGAELVVGYGLFNTSKETLAELGIETLENLGDCGHDGLETPPEFTVEMVLQDIERFGEVFGTQDVAAASIAELEAELASLEAQQPEETATAVILYYFGGELGSHGGTNFSNDLLARAGLVNVFADVDSLYLDPSLESVIDSEPDYLVVHWGVEGETFDEALAAILEEPGVADMAAVQNGNIIGVPYDGLTATPGFVEGIRALIDGRSGGAS